MLLIGSALNCFNKKQKILMPLCRILHSDFVQSQFVTEVIHIILQGRIYEVERI